MNVEKNKQASVVPWWVACIPPCLLSIVTFLWYLPSLSYPFQFDDVANISKNFAIRFLNPFERWWRGPRWLCDALNRWNYMLGRFDPFVYRLTNVIIHIIAGLLIYAMVKRWCAYAKKYTFLHRHASLMAFIVASLFLFHPVQTQTVSYVIQARVEGLGTLSVLLLTYFFTVFATTSRFAVKASAVVLLFGCGLLAWGTKEMVIVAPLLLILIDWFFIAQMEWVSLKSRGLLHLVFSGYFWGLALHYLTTKFAVDTVMLKSVTGNNSGNILTGHAYDVITPYHFLISQFKVVLHYLWMFVWPFGISVEYDWQLSPSFFSYESFIPFLILSVLLVWAIYTVIKKRHSVGAFGLLWFFISVAPRSSIIPSPELVCDYKTYLASCGIFMILAEVLMHGVLAVSRSIDQHIQGIKNITKYIETPILAAVFLCLPIGAYSMMHNKIWGSAIEFWEHNIKHAPLKARAYNNYGVALNDAGRYEDSIVAYQKAIALDKHYSDPLSNIAVSYCLKGDLDAAINSLKSALSIAPNYPEAYNNLGSLYVKKKEYDTAEAMLNKATALRPHYGKAYYNLGRLHLEKNQQEVAWGFFKKAVECDLDNAEGFFTFAQVSMQLKKYGEAARAFQIIVDSGVVNEQVLFGLANAHYMLSNYDRAAHVYGALVRDNPLDVRYVYNLGETLFAQKEYARAHEVFQKVTTLPQPPAQAFFRVAHCLEHLNRNDLAQQYLVELEKAKAPDDFKLKIKDEITRLALQDAVNKNGGNAIGLNEMKKVLALRTTQTAVR